MHARLHRNPMRLVGLLLILLLLVSTALAQTTRLLAPGSSVTGTLDVDNVAQVYTFAGNEGDVVTLSAESETGLGLALLLTDAAGETVAQGFEIGGTTTLADVALPEDGDYYVTVLSALGVTLPTGSTFNLRFELVSGTEGTAESTEPVVVATR